MSTDDDFTLGEIFDAMQAGADDDDTFDFDDSGGIERTYLCCCGRTIEDGHSDSCYERIDDEFLERDKLPPL